MTKIVVSWNATPPNIDSNFILPPKASNPGGARLHVYYMPTYPVGAEAGLENDARNSYGLETGSIGKFHPGCILLLGTQQPVGDRLVNGGR